MASSTCLPRTGFYVGEVVLPFPRAGIECRPAVGAKLLDEGARFPHGPTRVSPVRRCWGLQRQVSEAFAAWPAEACHCPAGNTCLRRSKYMPWKPDGYGPPEVLSAS